MLGEGGSGDEGAGPGLRIRLDTRRVVLEFWGSKVRDGGGGRGEEGIEMERLAGSRVSAFGAVGEEDAARSCSCWISSSWICKESRAASFDVALNELRYIDLR